MTYIYKMNFIPSFILFLFFMSCNQNLDSSNNKETLIENNKETLIIGMWEGDINLKQDGYNLHIKIVTDVKSDNSWSQKGNINIENISTIEYSASGTWEIEGEYLIFVWEECSNPMVSNGKTREVDKILELSEKSLILDDEAGERVIYKRVITSN